jgi:hypothetical protein
MKLIGATSQPVRAQGARRSWPRKKLTTSSSRRTSGPPTPTIMHSNPLGKVPCLVMEGGEALFDSRVIVEYLDTLSPVGKLIPAVGRERAEVKTWEALADGVLDRADPGAAGGQLGRPQEGRAQRGLDRPPARQDPRQPEGHEPGPGRQALSAPASTSAWPTSPSAARSATWISASATSTGAAPTRTSPSCRRSCRSGQLSRNRLPRSDDGLRAAMGRRPARKVLRSAPERRREGGRRRRVASGLHPRHGG